MIAILLGHVEVEFPYISDTGTHVPESNIFAQSLNMVACLGLFGFLFVFFNLIKKLFF